MTRPIVNNEPKPPKSRGTKFKTKKSRHANKKGNGNGGNGNGNGPKYFGSVGGYQGVKTKPADRLIDNQFQALLRQLKQQKQGIKRDARQDSRQANRLYNRSVGDINHIYDEVGGYMGHMGDKINTQYDTTMGEVAGINQNLMGTLQSDTDAHRQAAMAEMQRLGIQQTGMDPRYADDAAYTQGTAQINAANQQSNLQMQQANANQISALLGGMSEGSRAAGLGLAVNTRSDNLSGIRDDKRDAISQIMNEMTNVRKEKPGAYLELLMQLQGQGFDQWMGNEGLQLDRQAMAMDRRAMNHGFAMDRAGLLQDAAYASTAANVWGQAAEGAPGYTPYGPQGPNAPTFNNRNKKRKKNRKPPNRADTSHNDHYYGPLASDN